MHTQNQPDIEFVLLCLILSDDEEGMVKQYVPADRMPSSVLWTKSLFFLSHTHLDNFEGGRCCSHHSLSVPTQIT